LFYVTRNGQDLQRINTNTAQLQTELWSAVQAPAMAQPTPVLALALSGMNDVLNSQGYTQAAWWNRIPIAAWVLMVVIAVCSNLLVGYRSRRVGAGGMLYLVLPLILSIAFFLVGGIDSPRSGLIRVRPQNLTSLVQSLPSL
jgi:lipopolysaccharide export LptBFGC system permease protein LptF